MYIFLENISNLTVMELFNTADDQSGEVNTCQNDAQQGS